MLLQTFYAVTAEWCPACRAFKGRLQDHKRKLSPAAQKLMEIHLVMVDADKQAADPKLGQYVKACSAIPTVFVGDGASMKPVSMGATEFLDALVNTVQRKAATEEQGQFRADTITVASADGWLWAGIGVAASAVWAIINYR